MANQLVEKRILTNITPYEYKKTLFDSNYDDWSMETSSFDKKIFGKENLIFTFLLKYDIL